MKYRKLGKNGPQVSALGLGCMGMTASYGPTDNLTSIQVIQRAYEQGVSFFDTADMYGNGENEQLVGKAIQPFRNKITLATKCGIKIIDGEHYIDNTASYIKQACESSLKRLGVDHIDLYYLHRYNPEIPLEESMNALLDLVEAGKVNFIGLSEIDADVLEAAHKVLGDKLIALQTEYSIANSTFAERLLPVCRKLGVAFVPYSPIGRGLLSGKLSHTQQLKESQALEFRVFLPQFQENAFSHNLQLVKTLGQIADKKHITLSQLALSWLLAQGEDIIPIPGTKKPAYLDENLAAVNITLDSEELAHVEAARKAHPIQGERYPEVLMKLFNLTV